MDGSHKQHRVKEAKTHMVHKLHDSISIEWKDRQNSVRSQNNDSAENCSFCFLFWVLHGAECKPGEKSLIGSLFSLFRKMLYGKKKKADITKGFCLCCSTGTDILQAGLPETGL